MAPNVEADYWAYIEDSPIENENRTLSDQVVDRYARSKFDHEDKQFLPAGCIDELVTVEAIIKELAEKDHLIPEDLDLSKEPKKSVVNFINERAKTVFAVAVLSYLRGEHLGRAMYQFMVKEFDDTSLPVKEEDLVNLVGTKNPWSKTRIHNFCREQWRFLAPIFSQQNFKIVLEPDHILPFIKKSSSVKEGAFSQVYEVEIHPAHQVDPIRNDDGSLANFAIKEFIIPVNDEKLRKDAEDVWASEVDTLDEISGLSHPNIIQRVAAITRGRQRFLMFLWADGGNLRDYWIANPNPTLTAALVRDVIEQLRGMAEALKTLHEYKDQTHYRHGDIKPENILNFKSQDKSRMGTFKVSDMGSAKRHSVATRLRERTGGKAFATMVYQAPEAITNKLAPGSRLYDIWSMGCVTLEFMVWLLYGYQELKEFSGRIKGNLDEPCSFFRVEQVEQEDHSIRLVAKIHPAVQLCLEDLSENPESAENTALGDLLGIIKTKLLIIALPERTESSADRAKFSPENSNINFTISQPFGRHRTSAAGFVKALDDILQHQNAKNNEKYWCTGRSRHNLRLSRTISNPTPGSTHLSVEWKPQSGPKASQSNIPTSLAIGLDQIHNVRART